MPNPRDWTALDKRLDNWSPPQESFNPSGTWTTHYARHALIPQRDGTPGGGQVGSLHIEQKPQGDTIQLQISEKEKAGFTTLTTRVGVNCTDDALLTPRRWSLNCSWESPLAVVKTGEIDQQHTGRAEGKELVLNGTKQRRTPAPDRWTTFWNLFAAIQRLPFETGSTLTFDLLESFDQHKPGHRVTYAGRHAVTLKKQRLNLHVFEQTGRGIMPWHWWLDDKHHVILAAGNRRAYLLMQVTRGGEA
jgi:hypothetical protein